MIKSRRIRWVRHVANTRDMRNGYKIFDGKPEWRGYVEDLGVD
jgi:hypothetical protein